MYFASMSDPRSPNCFAIRTGAGGGGSLNGLAHVYARTRSTNEIGCVRVPGRHPTGACQARHRPCGVDLVVPSNRRPPFHRFLATSWELTAIFLIGPGRGIRYGYGKMHHGIPDSCLHSRVLTSAS